MPLVLTTGFAFDQVLAPASPLFGLASLETGKP